MFSYIRKWLNVWEYLSLPKNKKHVVFYSEGKNYWSYLEPIIIELSLKTKLSITYITSDENDPGLLVDLNIKKLLIDCSYMREWFFQNINCHIMIMTMPDLDNFQIKKSNKTDHYIYTNHSLSSLSSAFRKHAVSNYDAIVCQSEYHYNEILMQEKFYKQEPKNLIKAGYCKIDMLVKEYAGYKLTNKEIDEKIILLAPTWGENCIIETGKGIALIRNLLDQGYQVVLRPHPETYKHAQNKINEINNSYQNNEGFTIEANITSHASLFSSSALLTDWSGIAWEYSLALNKPVLFYDVKEKINNEDYHDMPFTSFEKNMREEVGIIWNGYDSIDHIINNWKNKKHNPDDYVYNIRNSSVKIREYIQKWFKENSNE